MHLNIPDGGVGVSWALTNSNRDAGVLFHEHKYREEAWLPVLGAFAFGRLSTKLLKF